MSDSLFDDFIHFRAAIERAVSITWNHERFRTQFLENPLLAMNSQFGYDCPFDVTMKAKRADDHFDPVHTGGWVGANNTVRLYLPPVPEDPKQKAEALATFNQDRVLFLSRK